MSKVASAYTSAHLIYPHQLFISTLSANKSSLLIMIEDDLFFRQYAFHKQKLIFHRASMTEFKNAAEASGYSVIYIESSDTTTSMESLSAVLKKYSIQEVSYYDLVDNWLEKRLTNLLNTNNISSRRLISPGFLTNRGDIADYFASYPNRMQQFYEWQRKRLDILVKNGKPVGGKWSFDAANRKKLPKNIILPPAYPVANPESVVTATKWVENTFPSNPGTSKPFAHPVTHAQANIWLDDFISHRLPTFGPYEDAIDSRSTELFHSVLSPLLNIGLITPHQIIEKMNTISPGTIPIESLEGYIRQLIGWREYMRATYVHYGATMRTTNNLQFTRKLPKSWWTGNVGIAPVDAVITNVLKTGYAHHIERLMILGNSMVLLRFNPDDVYEWFMSLFIDAYDWVMVPNVYAMSQFAAADLITTKPYISGSNYIIKMSDFKKDTWADVWDALYWTFVRDHKKLLESNYRSAMMVKLYERMDASKKAHLTSVANKWLT